MRWKMGIGAVCAKVRIGFALVGWRRLKTIAPRVVSSGIGRLPTMRANSGQPLCQRPGSAVGSMAQTMAQGTSVKLRPCGSLFTVSTQVARRETKAANFTAVCNYDTLLGFVRRLFRLRRSKIVVATGLFAGAALAAVACIQVDYSDQPFLCDPRGGDPRCPESYICCSDDPAALTADEDGNPLSDPGALPGINKNEKKGKDAEDGFAEPLFAGEKNSLSSSGVCVRQGSAELSFSGTEAAGCPIPCNPNWSAADVEAVCGVEDAVCCQTVELGVNDCVEDDNGCFRPATGDDARLGKIKWPGEVSTPQSPRGCEDQKKDSDAYRQCVGELGVASSRGFCIAPVNGKPRACPLAGKPNICEQKNASNSMCN
jgi:hypothetical protein